MFDNNIDSIENGFFVKTVTSAFSITIRLAYNNLRVFDRVNV